MSGHLFVYGTLRSDCAGLDCAAPGAEARALIRDRCTYVGVGRISGLLHVVDGYPALVRGRGPVFGEVWRLGERAELLRALSAYEGEGYELDACYPRVDNGKLLRGLVWRYVAPIGDAPRIDSGDYRLWALSRSPGAPDSRMTCPSDPPAQRYSA